MDTRTAPKARDGGYVTTTHWGRIRGGEDMTGPSFVIDVR
jgi:hypothetical protein